MGELGEVQRLGRGLGERLALPTLLLRWAGKGLGKPWPAVELLLARGLGLRL
jgi:hypothetical protein